MKWLDPAWWKGLSQLTILECPESDSGPWRMLHMHKDQHRVAIDEAHTFQTREEMLRGLLQKPKQPIVLCLWGDFVMERLVAEDQVADPVSAVLGVQVGDPEDFEIMEFAGTQGKALIALMRGDKLAETRKSLGEHGERVISAAFSQGVLQYVLPQALPDFYENNYEIQLSETRYLFKNGLFAEAEELLQENFEKPRVNVLAGEIETEEAYLPLYGAAMQTWFTEPAPDARVPMAAEFASFVRVSRLKQIAVMSALFIGLWFVILFSFRMQGERKKAELENTYSQNLPVFNAINSLDEKIAARENLRERLGTRTLAPTRSSFYYDRLAAVVPAEVRLLQTIYQPEEADFKRFGIREETEDQLILRGECSASAPIAQLSGALEKADWLSQLTVHRSEKNFQSGLYEFIFLIRLTDV